MGAVAHLMHGDKAHTKQQDLDQAQDWVLPAAGSGHSGKVRRPTLDRPAADLSRAVHGRSSARAEKLRSRRLLVTTKTLLNAMAAPAIIGLSKPAAAKGSAATL